MTDTYLHGIFCDDIRFEVANKQSLIGIYAGYDLVFQEPFPAALPKLCIQATFVRPAAAPPKDLVINVTMNGEIILSADIPAEALQKSEREAENGIPPKNALTANLVISPLVVDRESKLRLEAIADGVKYHGPSLRIKDTPPPEASEAAG